MDEIILDCKVFFGVDDIEEELSSAEFLRMVRLLPAYKGAVRSAVEAWANEHEAELEEMKNGEVKAPPVSLTPDQLRSNPKLGAAPAAGQMAPIFDIREL